MAEDITVKTNKKKLSVTRSNNSFDDFTGSAISNHFKRTKKKDFRGSLYIL